MTYAILERDHPAFHADGPDRNKSDITMHNFWIYVHWPYMMSHSTVGIPSRFSNIPKNILLSAYIIITFAQFKNSGAWIPSPRFTVVSTLPGVTMPVILFVFKLLPKPGLKFTVELTVPNDQYGNQWSRDFLPTSMGWKWIETESLYAAA